jgi:hypothetical protein
LKTPNAPPSPFVPAQTVAGSFGSIVRLKMVKASPVGPPLTDIPEFEGVHVFPALLLLMTPALLSVTNMTFFVEGWIRTS